MAKAVERIRGCGGMDLKSIEDASSNDDAVGISLIRMANHRPR